MSDLELLTIKDISAKRLSDPRLTLYCENISFGVIRDTLLTQEFKPNLVTICIALGIPP